jgi:type II secretory pathway component GspD/PulD (secretin)
VKEGTNNIQQFFYKHVGALISVTPARVFKEDGVTKDDVIQLKIVVRLSAANAKNMTTLNANGEPTDRPINFEDDVRAVANVIQVKSGYGVVMAGLLGEHEKKIVRKVPVIGDAPVVGFLFRSKGTERQKTETLIFVEAKVLHDDPCIAKAQSYEDFRLGEAYVRSSDVLDNPLEEGVYRAGFGTYLPPYSCDEARFWERLGRKVRRAATVLDDATE